MMAEHDLARDFVFRALLTLDSLHALQDSVDLTRFRGHPDPQGLAVGEMVHGEAQAPPLHA
jgi:hypothetical protein